MPRHTSQYQHYSVPENDSVHSAENIEALYEAIKNKMLPCNVVLIMAGMDAIYNKWIPARNKNRNERLLQAHRGGPALEAREGLTCGATRRGQAC